jgi:hypothetical protein
MNKNEIIDYLTVELKRSIHDDILPAIGIGQPTGGYFSTPRLVLSCVDYLGALYCGWNPTQKWNNGRPKFTAGWKSIKYLKEIFGEVFPDYRVRAELLWEMYRNGTVHLVEPKVLKNGPSTIHWNIFKGALNQRMIDTGRGGSIIQRYVSHLVPIQLSPNDWELPLGICCLYQDLENSLDKYANHIQTETTPILESNFRSAMDEIAKPENTTISWP